jgi:hypothetical protein
LDVADLKIDPGDPLKALAADRLDGWAYDSVDGGASWSYAK